ncbi:MAG: class I SAM-dependent methyltransferase, partial [Bacteroidia bacterium]
AEFVPKCYSLNLSDEELQRRGLPQNYIDLHRHFSQGNPRITHLFGDSRSFDFTPYEGKSDLVFIDGDHHFDSVVEDTRTAFRLVSEKGIIVWHDYSNSPESTRWNVAHAIWKGCPDEKKAGLRAISHTLCAAYLPFEIKSSERIYPRNPGKGYEITIRKSEA